MNFTADYIKVKKDEEVKYTINSKISDDISSACGQMMKDIKSEFSVKEISTTRNGVTTRGNATYIYNIDEFISELRNILDDTTIRFESDEEKERTEIFLSGLQDYNIAVKNTITWNMTKYENRRKVAVDTFTCYKIIKTGNTIENFRIEFISVDMYKVKTTIIYDKTNILDFILYVEKNIFDFYHPLYNEIDETKAKLQLLIDEIVKLFKIHKTGCLNENNLLRINNKVYYYKYNETKSMLYIKKSTDKTLGQHITPPDIYNILTDRADMIQRLEYSKTENIGHNNINEVDTNKLNLLIRNL